MRRTPRRPPAAVLALLLCLVGPTSACEPDNEHPPDQLLRDSLGLGDEDRVWRIRLDGREGRERVQPTEVRIPPGALVEFVTTDRRLHRVTFSLDSMPERAAVFLRSTEQAAGPAMVELDSRFVVTFRDAPVGRYPFRVEGNGESGGGTVVVELEEG